MSKRRGGAVASKVLAGSLLTASLCLSIGEVNIDFNRNGSVRDMLRSFHFDVGPMEAEASSSSATWTEDNYTVYNAYKMYFSGSWSAWMYDSRITIYNNGNVVLKHKDGYWDNDYTSANLRGLTWGWQYPWLSNTSMRNSIRHITESTDSKQESFGGLPRFFEGATNLITVNSPNMSPGYRTFYGCTNLKSAIIRSTSGAYTEVGDSGNNYMKPSEIFGNCTNLTDVTFTSPFVVVRPYMFNNCINLVNVNTEAFTEVCTYAFKNCKNLKITDLSNLRYVYEDAFTDVEVDLISSLDNLKFAAVGVFKDSKVNLNAFPVKLERVGEYAFYNSNCKFDTLNLSQLLKTIDKPLGDYSFCSNGITELTLLGNGKFNPKAFDVIEKLTISPVTNFSADLTSLNNLDSIYWYGDVADDMKPEYIPSTAMVYVVQGSNADIYCEENNITHTHIDASEVGIEPSISDATYVYGQKNDVEVDVNYGTKANSETTISNVYLNGNEISDCVNDEGNIIFDKSLFPILGNGTYEIKVVFATGREVKSNVSVSGISDDAVLYEWVSNNTMVKYRADKVLLIEPIDGTDGKMANYYSSSTTSTSASPWLQCGVKPEKVIVNDGVTSLGNYALAGLSSVTEITLTRTLNSLGRYCFNNTNSFTELVLPNGVTSIPYECFWNASSLAKLKVGNLTNLESYSLESCYALDELYVGKNFSVPTSTFKSQINYVMKDGKTLNVYVPRGGKAEELYSGYTWSGKGTVNFIFVDVPSIEGTKEYDAKNVTDITFEIGWGEDESKASSVSNISDLKDIDYSISDNVLTLSQKYLSSLPDGEYKYMVTFDNEYTSEFSITVKNSTVGRLQPSIVGESTYSINNYAKPYTVSLPFNIDEKTAISSVYYNDTCLKIVDKTYSYDNIAHTISIPDSVFSELANGNSGQVSITFDDPWNTTLEYTIQRVDNGGPSVLSDSVSYNGKVVEDVVIDVDLGAGDLAATTISSITVDNVELDSNNYDLQEDGLHLRSDYCETLNNGFYEIVITFDEGTEGNVTLTVNNSTVGKNKPVVLSNTKYFHGNEPNDILFNFSLDDDVNMLDFNSKDGLTLEDSDYEYVDERLTIKSDMLSTLEDGDYLFEITFDDVWDTVLELKVIKEDKRYASIDGQTLTFDAEVPEDVVFDIDLGNVEPISRVRTILLNNKSVPKEVVTIGDGQFILSADYLKFLEEDLYDVKVLLADGSILEGSSLLVINTKSNQEPPEALVTIKYEFYKDYPDHVIVPIKLNGASNITQLKIGTEIVDEAYYELQEGAILINSDYLSTLEAGKYRVLPTFDDKANTTISNIQLIVYEAAADRAAPYLLQSRVIFTGDDFDMTFDEGQGDLRAENVLALVIDDSLVLPNGDILPFKQSNVTKVQKAYALAMEEEVEKPDIEKPDVEKPDVDSNAEKADDVEESSTEEGTESSTEESVEEGSTEENTEESVEAGSTEESTESSTEESVEESSTEESAESSTEESIEEDSTEESTESSTESSTEESVEEASTEESTESSTEESVEESSTEITSESLELSITTIDSVQEQAGDIALLSEVYENYDNLVFGVSGNTITVNGEFIEAMNLSEGDHLVGAIFDNTERTTDIKKVILTIPGSGSEDEGREPEFTKVNKAYDKANPTDATYSYDLGTGDKGATDIVSVTIDGKEVEFKIEDNKLIIPSDVLYELPVGNHTVEVKFNDDAETTVGGMTIVVKDTSATDDNTDKPSGGDNTDKPSGGDNTDKPSGGDNTDKPSGGDNTDKPSGGDNTDKPSGGYNTDKPYKPGNSGGSSGGSSSGGSTSRPSGGSGSSGGGSSSRPSRPSSGSDTTHGPGVSGGTTTITDNKTPLNQTPTSPKNTDGSYNSQYKPGVVETGGTWYGSGDKWSYMKPDGTMARSEWVGHEGESYYINADGVMETGWFLDATGKWFMLNTDHNGKFGAALKGWHYEKSDGKWYFLSPVDGVMLVGWQFIDSKNYYFTEVNGGQTYFGDNVSGWVYDSSKGRPYGSMYAGEKTPDGKTVDSNGARID